jgi:hypothetical protein
LRGFFRAFCFRGFALRYRRARAASMISIRAELPLPSCPTTVTTIGAVIRPHSMQATSEFLDDLPQGLGVLFDDPQGLLCTRQFGRRLLVALARFVGWFHVSTLGAGPKGALS